MKKNLFLPVELLSIHFRVCSWLLTDHIFIKNIFKRIFSKEKTCKMAAYMRATSQESVNSCSSVDSQTAYSGEYFCVN